ncbi:MAG: acetyl-CoA C-acyltransferase [Pirellulales bacterium]
MPHSFIVAACRTPIGKFLGGLSSVPAPQLGAVVVREALRRSTLPADRIDEVIIGNVLSAGLGQAPARQAALHGGLPPTIAALTVNKVCGSGMKAIMLADQAIRAGDARAIIAGGMESMSQAPYVLQGAREGWTFGDQKAIDSMLHDGLWCAFDDVPMGQHAEHIAASCQVTRPEQDAFAAESHRRALSAIEGGLFDDEIVAVTVPGRRNDVVVSRDEGPRSDSSLDVLAQLKPSFKSDGCITAGNASQLSDGAAAVVVADEAIAKSSGSRLAARIIATATSGTSPKDLFIAPVAAIERVMAKAELRLNQIDLVELNEAFAAQCLACMKPLGLMADKMNVHGGAIALGHPIGASGARIVVTMLHALAQRKLRRGLAAACLGGGNAVAMIVELVV